MGVDLGLAAADSYYKADDARVLRDQQRQRADAELSLLPDKVAAERSGYQLKGAQNKANLDLVPNQAAVAKAMSDYSVEELPRMIAQKRRDGVFNDVDAQTAGVAKLADLIQMGDPAQVTSYLNAWRKTNPNQGNQTEVASVGFQKDPKTGENVFMAMDANGTPVMQMSASQIQRIKDSIGKTDLKVAKPGETIYGIKNGHATPMATAPVDQALIKSQNKQHTPADIQIMDDLQKHGVAKDRAHAWELVRSSKEKTRSAFVQEFVLKNALPGQSTAKLEKQGSDLYDNLRTGTPPPRSNSSPAATIDPRVNSLIGLPSP